jgi:hypothetical protein
LSKSILAEENQSPAMDYVTVLTCASDRFATKQRIWMESAQQWHTISYDKAYWFGYGRAEVDGINRLGELLEWARDKPHTLFIRNCSPRLTKSSPA